METKYIVFVIIAIAAYIVSFIWSRPRKKKKK